MTTSSWRTWVRIRPRPDTPSWARPRCSCSDRRTRATHAGGGIVVLSGICAAACRGGSRRDWAGRAGGQPRTGSAHPCRCGGHAGGCASGTQPLPRPTDQVSSQRSLACVRTRPSTRMAFLTPTGEAPASLSSAHVLGGLTTDTGLCL